MLWLFWNDCSVLKVKVEKVVKLLMNLMFILIIIFLEMGNCVGNKLVIRLRINVFIILIRYVI